MAEAKELDKNSENCLSSFQKLTLRDLQKGTKFTANLESDFELNDLYESDDNSDGDQSWKSGEPKHDENKATNIYQPPPPMSTLEELAENVTSDGGIKKLVLRSGSGVKPPVGSRIFFEYVAFKPDVTEWFDSATGNRTLAVVLDETCWLINGLKIGLTSMEVREEAQFLFHFEYAFGPFGCPPRIPAGSSLIFNVRVVKFLTPEMLLEVSNMSRNERNQLTFSQLNIVAKNLRTTGNTHYNLKNYSKAIRAYRRAIDYLENFWNVTDKDVEERAKVLESIYCNLAICYIKLGKAPQACNACKVGLAQVVTSHDDKLYFRYAHAKMMLGDYNEALRLVGDAEKAGAVKNACKHLRQQIFQERKESKGREKAMCSKMMKGMDEDKDTEANAEEENDKEV